MKSIVRRPLLLLLLLTILVYLPGMTAPFVWDDEQFIYKNQYVQNFDLKKIWTQSTTAGAGVTSSYFRPLTSTSFALDHLLWGNVTFGFHLTNLLLHLGAGSLIYLAIQQFTKDKKAAWIVAAIFLLHPIHVESVTYINSRGDSLYTLFTALSLWLWLRLLDKDWLKIQLYNLSWKIGPVLLAVGVMVSYILAILSKEIGLAGAGLLAAAAGARWLTNPAGRRRHFLLSLSTLIPTTIVTGLYLYWRTISVPFSETAAVLANYPASYAQLSTRLLTFSKALLTYLRLIFLPYPLHMERTTPIIESIINPYTPLAILVVLSLIYFGWREFRQHRQTNIWFGLAWFLALLIPVSGILPVNGLIYHHWLYLPIAGFALLTYSLIKLFKPHFNFTHLSFILPLMMILSWRQVYIWSDPIRLYRHTLKYAPTARVYNNLGMELASRGFFQSALDAYNESLKISRSYPQTYHNLGNVYVQLNQPGAAIDSYTHALEIDANFRPSYQPLISLLRQTNQPEQAEYWSNRYQQINQSTQ